MEHLRRPGRAQRLFTSSSSLLSRARRWSILVACGALALGFTAAMANAFGASTSPSPAAGKIVLRVGWTNDPDNLNPFIGYESSSYEIMHLNYDLLVGFSATDMGPRPELATSWTHSADGKVWTFQIRQGVKWQDGVPFTAHDVAFTYNYILKNQLSAYYSYLNNVKSVTAPNDSTVVITCSKPKANILALFIPIVPEHIWGKIPPKAAENTYVNKPPIIGTGPFQTTEVVKGRYVIMQANKDYWRGAPKIDEIIFNTYQNADNMVADLRTGALDVAWDIPKAQFQALSSTPGIKTLAGMGMPAEDELCFNAYKGASSLANPAVKDPAFRRALNWAVDRNKIVQLAYDGYATPGSSIIPSGYYSPALDWHWQPPADEAYGFDLNKARQLLAQAGYKDSDGDGIVNDPHTGKDVVLRLWARSESTSSQISARLIAGWFRQVGVKINLSVMDDGAISDKNYNTVNGKYAPDFDMYVWGWGWDVDPDFALSVFTTSQINGWSDCGWADPAYDKLYTLQQTTIDPQQRKQVVWQMEEMLYRESPYIVLAYPKELEAYNVSRWAGWVQAPAKVGLVIYTNMNVDTYWSVHPKTGTVTTGSSHSWLIVLIVVAAIVVALVVWLLVRRRRPLAEE